MLMVILGNPVAARGSAQGWRRVCAPQGVPHHHLDDQAVAVVAAADLLRQPWHTWAPLLPPTLSDNVPLHRVKSFSDSQNLL